MSAGTRCTACTVLTIRPNHMISAEHQAAPGGCLGDLLRDVYHHHRSREDHSPRLCPQSLAYCSRGMRSPPGGTLARGRRQTSRRPLLNTRYLLGGTHSSTAVPYLHSPAAGTESQRRAAALAQFAYSLSSGSHAGVRCAWQGCLMEGMLLKQGGKRSDAFKKRWITLSGVTLTYRSSKAAPALGEVPMAEVLGMAVSDAPEGADNAGNCTQLQWRKSCAGLDADYRRAHSYSVGQVTAFPFASSVGRIQASEVVEVSRPTMVELGGASSLSVSRARRLLRLEREREREREREKFY